MIRATIQCRLIRDPRLLEHGGKRYTTAYARSLEADGTAQTLRLWTTDPELRGALMRLRAGSRATVTGSLVARAVVPRSGTGKVPLIELHIETITSEGIRPVHRLPDLETWVPQGVAS